MGDDIDRQYHIEAASGEVAETVLLPGDPDRVDVVTDRWDEATTVADHREYRTVTGRYEGAPLSVTSTGIGSPSAAIAVEELARIGAETFVRVGSCGAIDPDVDVGDLVITTGAVRGEGTSDEYVRGDYPAVADHAVVSALVAAAERLGYTYHCGLTMSTDSFYAGQARPGFEGFEAAGSASLLDDLREVDVTNVEMEASAVLTLANVYGLRAGAVCTVFANRSTGEFRTEGEARAAEVGSLAAALLNEMDARRDDAGAGAWHADLSIE
ncbi:nucleoside phosphorylase [Haloplanus salilacus]|uniref:nucleoside phosphorylase n=1 Tax=Haloplanus salilacus TaxID=2949994 RepID=UPI0030D5D58F